MFDRVLHAPLLHLKNFEIHNSVFERLFLSSTLGFQLNAKLNSFTIYLL